MVDCLVVTFIREEYEAIRHHFFESAQEAVSGAPGATRVVSVSTRSGNTVEVAIARIAKEGNVSALDGVLELIAEQHPKLVLAVGIAGAVPTSDIFLGDVLFVNDIHDMTRGAETGTGREEATASTYLMNAVKEFVANVTTDDFKEWQEGTISTTRPMLEGIGNAWTEDEDWNAKINRVLQENKERRLPVVIDGVIASSDHLVKSEAFMQRRLLVDRGILANDMESVGVAKACERKGVPLLIIRGISDIVGLDRSDEWKLYACAMVAGCAREVVNLDVVETIINRVDGGQPRLSDAAKSVIGSLESTLARIRTGGSAEVTLCREAFRLFEKLPMELKRRWAPELFDTLDRPMKYLGDKRLVLDVAKSCIGCCSGPNLDDQTAECQARARICGTSWAYQRTGNLGWAEQEAEESVEISEGIGSDKNLAFCMKCLGRLKRLRAEAELNEDVKRVLFEESVSKLHEAITIFGRLGDFGSDHPEVGDCYSLLGRTKLNAGDIRGARESAAKGRELIDDDSKDYLDLRILEGDLHVAKREYEDALSAFDEVVETTSRQDYQVSEIVARAHRQKGQALVQMGKRQDAAAEFAAAAEIWADYGEPHFAAESEWCGIVASGELERRTIRLLEKEKPQIRCGAVKLYRDRKASRGRRVVAQRIGADDTVWRNLVRESKHILALHPESD